MAVSGRVVSGNGVRLMRTKDIIEGLQILQEYRDDQDGYDYGAEHDVLYAYATDRPVEAADIDRLIELGWFQESCGDDDEFAAKHYDPEESWAAFT